MPQVHLSGDLISTQCIGAAQADICSFILPWDHTAVDATAQMRYQAPVDNVLNGLDPVNFVQSK